MNLCKVNIWIDAILTDNKTKLSEISKGRLELLKDEMNKLNRLEKPDMQKIAEDTKNLDLDSEATLIVDDDKKKYWELITNSSDEIESEELLQLLADNFPEGAKLYLFMPINDSNFSE